MTSKTFADKFKDKSQKISRFGEFTPSPESANISLAAIQAQDRIRRQGNGIIAKTAKKFNGKLCRPKMLPQLTPSVHEYASVFSYEKIWNNESNPDLSPTVRPIRLSQQSKRLPSDFIKPISGLDRKIQNRSIFDTSITQPDSPLYSPKDTSKKEVLTRRTVDTYAPARFEDMIDMETIKAQRRSEVFSPYTLRDYRKNQTMPPVKSGRLGPSDMGSEDWKAKKILQAKRKTYSKRVPKAQRPQVVPDSFYDELLESQLLLESQNFEDISYAEHLRNLSDGLGKGCTSLGQITQFDRDDPSNVIFLSNRKTISQIT